MTTILGIDLETTGLDPSQHQITEIGMCLWNVENQAPIEMTSFLINASQLNAETTELTGITRELLDYKSWEIGYGMSVVDAWAVTADYVVAHNAGFEKSFLEPLYSFAPNLAQKPWIDTRTDIPYKNGKGQGTLSDIAMGHGLFNPLPHRALPDVLVMLQLLAKYDFSEVVKYANAPMCRMTISFPYSADRVDAVKALGGWRFDGTEKNWWKECKAFQVDEECAKAGQAGFMPMVYEKGSAA